MDREDFNDKVQELMTKGMDYADAAFEVAKNIDEEANKKYHEVCGLWVENSNSRVAFKSSFKGLQESIKIPKGAVLIAFVNDKATPDNQQPNYRLVWSWN